MGMAVKLACEDLKKKMLEVAAKKVGAREDTLSFAEGKITQQVSGQETKTVEYTELFNPGPMGGAYIPGEGTLIGRAFWMPKTAPDPETGQSPTERAVAYSPVAQQPGSQLT